MSSRRKKAVAIPHVAAAARLLSNLGPAQRNTVIGPVRVAPIHPGSFTAIFLPSCTIAVPKPWSSAAEPLCALLAQENSLIVSEGVARDTAPPGGVRLLQRPLRRCMMSPAGQQQRFWLVFKSTVLEKQYQLWMVSQRRQVKSALVFSLSWLWTSLTHRWAWQSNLHC